MNLWDRIEARLVADWRDALKWWSVRWNAAGAVLMPLLMSVPSMPPEIQALLPESLRAVIAALWCSAAIGFRVWGQKSDGQ